MEDDLRIMQLAAEGLCCSQIMIRLALDDMGEENIPLVRSMAGLCEGAGEGGLCGVASGAVCVLALYAAKGSATEEMLPCYPVLVSQFMEWFKGTSTTWGGIRCEDIVAHNGGIQPQVCGNIMLRARETLIQLLVENNIDPSLPKEQAEGSF
ncbi:MAG: C_GCAxxG_C_C family protein [Desulfobulbus sp.]|nr:C_GCAxxG_C_C family protein [Desulfobulbus sp.]